MENNEVGRARALALLEAGRPHDAYRQIERYARYFGLDAHDLTVLSQIYERLGSSIDALEAADLALLLDPDLHLAHRARASALIGLGRGLEAVQAARMGCELAPDDSYDHVQLAYAYLAAAHGRGGKIGRQLVAQARSAAQLAWLLAPENPVVDDVERAIDIADRSPLAWRTRKAVTRLDIAALRAQSYRPTPSPLQPHSDRGPSRDARIGMAVVATMVAVVSVIWQVGSARPAPRLAEPLARYTYNRELLRRQQVTWECDSAWRAAQPAAAGQTPAVSATPAMTGPVDWDQVTIVHRCVGTEQEAGPNRPPHWTVTEARGDISTLVAALEAGSRPEPLTRETPPCPAPASVEVFVVEQRDGSVAAPAGHSLFDCHATRRPSERAIARAGFPER